MRVNLGLLGWFRFVIDYLHWSTFRGHGRFHGYFVHVGVFYDTKFTYIIIFVYICSMKSNKRVSIVFDVASREMFAYSDLTDAAGHVGVDRHVLSYSLDRDCVHYTGSCFVGQAEVAPSNRGGNKGKNQGFKS